MAYPVATEYDNNYATTGAVDVVAMQMSFQWNWDASKAEYDLVTISDMPNTKYDLKPWTECKRTNGTVLPYCIGSAYVSGIASDGLLRSQPGLKPERNQSHNNMITNYQKKGKGYWGASAERNTFQILFNIIKGATKNSQSLFHGCTSYSFQYSASIESADAHTYFPVTNDQAKNILVGSYVSVGYGQLNDTKNGVNNDRGVANIHKYADDVKVLKIETLDANNKAVYLDIETGFNTMPIKLSDTVNAPITITSMHWWSGSTRRTSPVCVPVPKRAGSRAARSKTAQHDSKRPLSPAGKRPFFIFHCTGSCPFSLPGRTRPEKKRLPPAVHLPQRRQQCLCIPASPK